MKELKNYIRDVPDFPKKGIVFKDITTLLKDQEAFKDAIDQLTEPFREAEVDIVVGIESRGFIFGSAVAYKLGAAFVPVRKPGKLPADALKEEYALEYGTDVVEIHQDSIKEGQKVLIVDDLLATGGTMEATCKLIEQLKAQIVGIRFLIELTFLKGKEKLSGYDVSSIIEY